MLLILQSNKSTSQSVPLLPTASLVHPDPASFVANQGTHLRIALCHKTLPKLRLPVENSRASQTALVALPLQSTKQLIPVAHPPKLLAVLPPALLQSNRFTPQLLPQTSLPSPDQPRCFQHLVCQPSLQPMTILLTPLPLTTRPLTLHQPWINQILVGPDLSLSKFISNRHMQEFTCAGAHSQTTCCRRTCHLQCQSCCFEHCPQCP